MLLVDEWISEHPVRTTLLSPGKVRFAAAKILVWQSGKATSAWPGEGAAQLVGILLCLLAFEGLSDHQAPVALPSTVLGLSCADILDLAREAVQRKGLTREEIVEAVSEMDTNGDMTQLATSVELAEALFRVGDGDTEPIAESAHWVPDLIAVGLGRAAPMLERAVRLRLARRFLTARLLLVLLVPAWFLYAEFIQYRMEQPQLPSTQMLIFGICLGLGTIIMAALFPSNLDSPEGRKFVLPAAVPCVLCACMASWISYFGQDAARTHVNAACRRVHAAICLGIIFNWSNCGYLAARGRLTWRALRGLLLCDGAIFFVGNLLLWGLGPPQVYQPRNMTFAGAMSRAAISPGVALLLSPTSRNRIASAFNRFGWNHVTLSLRTLRRVRFRDGGEGLHGRAGSESSKSSRSSHSSGGKVGRRSMKALAASRSRGGALRFRHDALVMAHAHGHHDGASARSSHEVEPGTIE